ncbi:hypothetical protein [Pseudoxanthomonas wuyuanensis]
MNISLRTAAVSLSALLLSACAGTQEMTRTHVPAAEPQAKAVLTSDQAYIAYVERVARRRGIHVMWVNPPQKRLVATE